MSLARASPGWDSTCNQRISFPWGKIQRWIFPGHSWVWWWDMEIHLLQLFQGLPQVGEEIEALKQQHRGKLHLGNYLYKNPILFLFAGFLGTGPQHVGSAASETRVLHSHIGVCKCPATDTGFFHCSRFQIFQQVAFSFLRSIHRNSAGAQQRLCLHRLFVLWNGASSDSFAVSWALWASPPLQGPASTEPPSQDTKVITFDSTPSHSRASLLRCQLGYEMLFLYQSSPLNGHIY